MSASHGSLHLAYVQEGWAARYDRFRPSPPEALVDFLCRQARVERPSLVVDLGCGTGLSTAVWADRAERVVGVEANPLMLAEARRAANVEYRQSCAEATELSEESADIVTCSQSFHWMDSAATLSEAARILRPGGVFAAYEYDLPPLTTPEVDDVFEAVLMRAGYQQGASQGIAAHQLDVLRASGAFRSAREAVLHRCSGTDAERLVGFARSLGQVGQRIAEGDGDEALGLDRLRSVAEAAFADRSVPAWWSYRIAIGIR
jgi:ubiquinone/menaquinone biosynthesis C-methylase UbiE